MLTIKKTVRAKDQAALRRADAGWIGDAAFELRTCAGERNTKRAERGAINVGPEYALRMGIIRFVCRHMSSRRHLCIEPRRLAYPREVCRLTMLEHEVGDVDGH